MVSLSRDIRVVFLPVELSLDPFFAADADAVAAASRNIAEVVAVIDNPLLTFTLAAMDLFCSGKLILLYLRCITTFGRNINSKTAMQTTKMSIVIVK